MLQTKLKRLSQRLYIDAVGKSPSCLQTLITYVATMCLEVCLYKPLPAFQAKHRIHNPKPLPNKSVAIIAGVSERKARIFSTSVWVSTTGSLKEVDE